MTTARPPESRPGGFPRIEGGRLILALGLIAATGGRLFADGGVPGTIVLFDGKSLAGWERTDFANAGEVKVEGGRIVMAEGRPMTGITTTRKDLPRVDYELSYEAMRLDGRDFFAAATFRVGDSYLTLVNGGWGGNVTGLSSLDGMDASENETGQFVKYENRRWYRFRVRVTADVIVCEVDGKRVVALEHRDHQLGTRIETRANQPLGFANYDGSSAIRDVSIRPLTPAEVEAANKSLR